MAVFRRKYITESAWKQLRVKERREGEKKAHKYTGKRTQEQIYPQLKPENKVSGLEKFCWRCFWMDPCGRDQTRVGMFSRSTLGYVG